MVNTRVREPGSKDQESYWSLKGLPPFPAVVTRLLNLLSTDDYSMHQLVDLVRADPMFASELLLTANSAKYGLGKEVTSIRHAAAILGRETMRSFAVAVSLRMYIGRVARNDLLAKLWRHSLATAVICDLLAECQPDVRENKRDETPYVAGLLHDIGCLCLMVMHPKSYAGALSDAINEGSDLQAVEQELFDIDHCSAGQRIAHAWKFSPSIAEVALRHHEPPTGSNFNLLELVKVAVLMADSLGYEVVPPKQVMTLEEVAALLPPAAQANFNKQIDELPERIAGRIRSFEI